MNAEPGMIVSTVSVGAKEADDLIDLMPDTFGLCWHEQDAYLHLSH